MFSVLVWLCVSFATASSRRGETGTGGIVWRCTRACTVWPSGTSNKLLSSSSTQSPPSPPMNSWTTRPSSPTPSTSAWSPSKGLTSVKRWETERVLVKEYWGSLCVFVFGNWVSAVKKRGWIRLLYHNIHIEWILDFWSTFTWVVGGDTCKLAVWPQ